jgi:hypothetical protein
MRETVSRCLPVGAVAGRADLQALFLHPQDLSHEFAGAGGLFLFFQCVKEYLNKSRGMGVRGKG